MDIELVAVVAIALLFDFTNGFHDAANAIATSVSTRALPPRVAVGYAAVLNFLGAFVFLEVAATVATGIVDAEVITLEVVLAGLVGSISWNLLTWYLGLPTSSSHALIGGAVGASIAAAGFDVVKWDGVIDRVAIPSLAAPVLGVLGAMALTWALLALIGRRPPGLVNRVFRRLQVVSAGFVAFTHGTNDAQKTMGIICLALIVTGQLSADDFDVPLWVIVSAATAMAAGTYAGGWPIINTLGRRITKLEPVHGFGAETATASILWTTGQVGFPVSTTHTISGSVLGAGASRRFSAVRWGIAGNIFVAWLFTIPCAALVGAGMEGISRAPGGEAVVFAAAIAVSVLAFRARAIQLRAAEAAQPAPAAAGGGA